MTARKRKPTAQENQNATAQEQKQEPWQVALQEAAGQLRQSLSNNVGSVLSEDLATGIMVKYTETLSAALKREKEKGNVRDQ